MTANSFPKLETISCSIQGTVASWPTYRFLGRQVRWSGIPISLRDSHSFFMIHTVKGFSVVDETEVDVSLEFPGFLYDPANVGNLISVSSSFSKPSLDNCKFLVHIMLKLSMQDFKHDITSMGDECNCPIAHSTLLGNWDEDWPFPFLWPQLGFPDLLTYWMQHLDGIIL